MGIGELLLVAVALAMDAFAVGMTNGMTDPKMKVNRVLLIAAFYGFFQFLMPVIGYWTSNLFSDLIGKIAPWVSFVLLGVIGGKMIYDGIQEYLANKKESAVPVSVEGEIALTAAETDLATGTEGVKAEKKLDIKTLTLQALATSIDALAVGVSFLALATQGTLCLNIWWNSLIIGLVAFALSVGAVYIGKAIGDKLADKASLIGGVVLVAIGLKILLEGIL